MTLINRDSGRIYAVGDADDTSRDGAPEEALCGAVDGIFHCTRYVGHGGNHAAGDSEVVVAVWEQTPSPTRCPDTHLHTDGAARCVHVAGHGGLHRAWTATDAALTWGR